MDNEVLEKSEQVLRLREKVLRAERERINREQTISVAEARSSVKFGRIAKSINADLMTTEQIHEKLERGYADIEKGNTQDAANAFTKARETHI